MGWRCEERWPNSTVYVIGGGPSILDTEISLIRHKPVVGVNSAIRLGRIVDILFFGDSRWLVWEYEQVKQFNGLIVTTQKTIKNPDGLDIRYIPKNRRDIGIETDKRLVCWNKSSGGCAINLAYHLGGRRIVLLGFDMKPNSELRHNWHDAYPPSRPERNPYKHFISAFETIMKAARKLDVEILNASVDTAIPESIVPRRSLESICISNM